MHIEIRNLTKRFGRTVAVDDLSFDVRPGRVTGFLGPNGSGKSTTMRCMVGLDRPQAGETTFDGRRYESLRHPLFEVGALFDAGLIDDVGLNVHPVLLGSGIPMFPKGQRQIDLELVESRPLEGGCIYLFYRVNR